MIGKALDAIVGLFSPSAGLRRMQSRRLMRRYAGAEANRLTNHTKPRNQSANTESQGPFGADAARAWSRQLVRDNAWAWGVVDTIVSSVVENGITAQSVLENEDGGDIEDANWQRDDVWSEWCEVADYNGEHTFAEIQRIAQREIVEAGEVLIHLVNVRETERGIYRKVPLALELVEADRLAVEYDTYKLPTPQGNRIVRGVEIDEKGKPIAYWIYPQHPNDINTHVRQTPKRILATDILHLFRRDRIGQSRGVTWFAPVMSWMRDLGVYVDNELQASAVAACFSVFVRTENGAIGLNGPPGGGTTDKNGNRYEFLEPGQVMYGNPNEGVDVINSTRPNTGAQSWIELMLRGIAVGTGLSYEVVARDYSKTNYSSSRTSQLEDRRRFRCWQKYLVSHLCQPVWDRFCDQAAAAGVDGFPNATELLADRRRVAPVEWQTPEWEWVDPTAEQTASQNSIDSLQSTYATECGSRGRNWKAVFYQRAKEERLRKSLGLMTVDQKQIESSVEAATASAQGGGSGEMSDSSRLQFTRNQKAIDDILNSFIGGAYSRARAKVALSAIGLSSENVETLLQDAADGVVDGASLSQETATA